MLDLPNLPAGWCCYVLLRSDGSYDCRISSNLSQHIRERAFNHNSGEALYEQPIALVWYESTKDRRSAAVRQRLIRDSSQRHNRKRAGKCVPFEGSGNNVWIPLVSPSSAAK